MDKQIKDEQAKPAQEAATQTTSQQVSQTASQ